MRRIFSAVRSALAASLCSSLVFLAVTATAGPGHDHGHDEHEEAASGKAVSAAPRLALESSRYELVGVLEADGLLLYLDDYASNRPVTGAALEVDIDGRVMRAEPEPDGTYHVHLHEPLDEGDYPVTVVVLAEKGEDRLSGELHVHGAAPMPQASGEGHDAHDASAHYLPWLGGVGAAAVLLLLGAAVIDRRQQGERA